MAKLNIPQRNFIVHARNNGTGYGTIVGMLKSQFGVSVCKKHSSKAMYKI